MRLLVRAACATAVVFVAACGGPEPSSAPSSSPSPLGTRTPAVSGEPTASPSISPSPSASARAAARPYDAPAVLAAMQASRRPGGVPDEVQTTPIADQLAAAIWTYDGMPWPTTSISGSCGPRDCTLDVSGTPEGAAGEDLYTFSITPANGTVALLVADLHGYPAALDPTLDAIARRGVATERLAGLALVGARWLAAPRDGQFVLSYRSGGEEGSPALDIAIDLASGHVLKVEKPVT